MVHGDTNHGVVLTNDQRKAIANLNDRHKNKLANNKLGHTVISIK